MASLHRNGTPWSDADERELVALLRAGTPHTAIAAKFGRSVPAINGKIGQLRRRARGEVRRFAVLRESVLEVTSDGKESLPGRTDP